MTVVILYWAIVTFIFVACPAYIAVAVTVLACRWLRGRRNDREWAADLGRRFRDRAYLDYLENQFSDEGSEHP